MDFHCNIGDRNKNDITENYILLYIYIYAPAITIIYICYITYIQYYEHKRHLCKIVFKEGIRNEVNYVLWQ